jgi:DNA mismatch repair protein MutS2
MKVPMATRARADQVFGLEDLHRIATRSGINLTNLDEQRLKELVSRIRLFDLDGVLEIVAVGRKKAAQLVKGYAEYMSGIRERRVFKTQDARRLAKEAISFFSERTSSYLGKGGLQFLSPSLDRGKLEGRYAVWSQGLDIVRRLNSAGRIGELRKVLSGLAFEAPTEKRKVAEPILITGFRARAQILASVISILKDFKELASFFPDVELGLLQEALDTLEKYKGSETEDAEALISDAELLINDKLKRGSVDPQRATGIIEEQIGELVDKLGMDSEEEGELRRAAFEGLSVPFEFDRTIKKRLLERYRTRKEQERAKKLARIETKLIELKPKVDASIERAALLDQVVAVCTAMEEFKLSIPSIGNGGIGFLNGRNLFLLGERAKDGTRKVQPVSYELGRTNLKLGPKARNVVMLTGANSGGKTTLLTTVATVHILTLLGLPVPCDAAETSLMPVYLFRRRATRKIGSLEQALGSLIPVFGDRHKKLVLLDEFEALTEPGAAGRILAAIMNAVATSSSILLLVTHLARETLPHVRLPVRVDGIEATGLDSGGELVVDRQPRFDHIGSSTPKLILMKLSKSSTKRDKQLYDSILKALGEESTIPVQTPISLPWLPSEGQTGKK